MPSTLKWPPTAWPGKALDRLDEAPVLALSSVTEVEFATQTRVPSEAMAAATSNLSREPDITA